MHLICFIVSSGMYTIEFQKRGLPHAHILIWLHGDNKINTVNQVNKYISAELPDSTRYPKLHEVVSNFMIHGPCGVSNPKSPCMKDGKCSKHFPKVLQAHTSIDKYGYPHYTRRQLGICAFKKGIKVDNTFVVPYNPYLLMMYTRLI